MPRSLHPALYNWNRHVPIVFSSEEEIKGMYNTNRKSECIPWYSYYMRKSLWRDIAPQRGSLNTGAFKRPLKRIVTHMLVGVAAAKWRLKIYGFQNGFPLSYLCTLSGSCTGCFFCNSSRKFLKKKTKKKNPIWLVLVLLTSSSPRAVCGKTHNVSVNLYDNKPALSAWWLITQLSFMHTKTCSSTEILRRRWMFIRFHWLLST